MLTKGDIEDHEACAKAFWLRRRRPEVAIWPGPGAFQRLLAADGYAVEALACRWLRSRVGDGELAFQVEFSDGRCIAKADAVQSLADARIVLIEIKSSTDHRDHVRDAAFQRIVAERAGADVASSHIVVIRKDYERRGDLVPEELFAIVDVDEEIAAVREEVERAIDEAEALLKEAAIDEAGCTCRHLGAARHCAAFAHLNPDVVAPSAHVLPRISPKRLADLDGEGRLSLADVTAEDVTQRQGLIVEAVRSGEPQVDIAGLRDFLGEIEFPIHFYDFETCSNALPQGEGHRPHEQLPVQFSCHVVENDGRVVHHEHLCETAIDQAGFADAFLTSVAPLTRGHGTGVVWNRSFETSCNLRLASLLPDTADAMTAINERTVDLMIPFSAMYVHPACLGSTSIKSVLPVLVPDLSYAGMAVGDGAAAIVAFREMVSEADPDRRRRLRNDLLEYCRLDSLAMLRIHQALGELTADG